MKVKSLGLVTRSTAMVALLCNHCLLRAQLSNKPEQRQVFRRSMDRRFLGGVQKIIAGTESISLGRGTRTLPVWGPLFSEITSDRDYGKARLYNVAKYLGSLQKQ